MRYDALNRSSPEDTLVRASEHPQRPSVDTGSVARMPDTSSTRLSRPRSSQPTAALRCYGSGLMIAGWSWKSSR